MKVTKLSYIKQAIKQYYSFELVLIVIGVSVLGGYFVEGSNNNFYLVISLLNFVWAEVVGLRDDIKQMKDD